MKKLFRYKRLLQKCDKPLFILMFIYIVIGLVMILSASSVSAVLRYDVPPSYFFIRQLLFVIASCFVGFLVVLPTSIKKKYQVFSVLYLAATIFLLFWVFGYGVIAGGAKSWINLGFFSLQPTEFAKTALILFMAFFYERSIRKKKSFLYNLIPILISIVIFVLVAKQPDFGGAVIIAGIVFFTFLVAPFENKKQIRWIRAIGITGMVLVIGLLYSGSDLFNSAHLSRLNFHAPCQRYMENTGYQVCNGFIAYHNGGLFGVGLGNSSQKYLYLPEAHTDFIYPILVEELGLVVGILILIGYMCILYRILKIAKNTDSIHSSIICYGTFIYFLLHLLINLMGTLALIPLTGVPVPFLSYGGSFNLNVILMCFVIQRIAIENNLNQEKREIARLT